jgi:outer membrane protein OmpA-like peptidoglycan-associated protein
LALAVLFLSRHRRSCGGGRQDEEEEHTMRNLTHRAGWVGAAAAATLLAGCNLSNPAGSPGGPETSPSVTVAPDVAATALLTVINGPASGPALSRLVASTARPNEDIRILQAGTPARTIVASDSPAPPAVILPGQPLPPGGGQTDYQMAQYAKRQKAWQARQTADLAAGAAQTRANTSAWLAGLDLPQKLSRLADPSSDQGSIAAESGVAASALAGLEEESGNIFGPHRVIVLFCDDLSGALPAGELTGDDVIVVISYLPTEAATSTAQADLLGAGAAQAAVVGSEVTAAQLATLVADDLNEHGPSDSVSAPVLFGNDSYALSPIAVTSLRHLLPELRKPGATAVINGYASTPGTAEANYILSFERADAVARWLEARGVPESALIIVGHGASDPVGSGVSATNRRVLVVTEKA